MDSRRGRLGRVQNVETLDCLKQLIVCGVELVVKHGVVQLMIHLVLEQQLFQVDQNLLHVLLVVVLVLEQMLVVVVELADLRILLFDALERVGSDVREVAHQILDLVHHLQCSLLLAEPID